MFLQWIVQAKYRIITLGVEFGCANVLTSKQVCLVTANHGMEHYKPAGSQGKPQSEEGSKSLYTKVNSDYTDHKNEPIR